MTFWFFTLGVPLFLYGLFSVAFPARAARALVAFPRCREAGWILCAIGWFWTAHELDVIGIEIFDRYLKAFPGELWILAAVLTPLTCWWMPNLLPLRGLAAVFMLFPASLFPAVRLCDTSWRLVPVAAAYVCAATGMFGMFYPWHWRRLLAWRAESAWRNVPFAAAYFLAGALMLALGALAAFGKIG